MTRKRLGTAGIGTVGIAAIAALLIAGLLIGVTASASPGAGGPTATAAKKKCGKKKKKKEKGKSAEAAKGCKKKKKKPPAALSVSPASFTYPDTEHESAPCPTCPTQAFTVTNTGGSASGVPASSITEVTQPVVGVHDPGFFISANTCTAAVAPGGTCTVTVRFVPPSNAGDGNYTSVLHVIASGSDAQASLAGHGV